MEGVAQPAADTLGLYISVPFCKAKCSFCNFASGVFAAERIGGYLDRVRAELAQARSFAATYGACLPGVVDTIYLGGGTPSLLEPAAVRQLFEAVRAEFSITTNAEITVECAPLQLSDASLAAFQQAGVNRLSFGVQSFVDRESAAVGRTHTGVQCREELRRVQAAGIRRAGIDLIVGLPHQTARSWQDSVEEALASGVEHVSLYLLEVDEDSRLGREALASGVRYGAAALPDEDATADWYRAGCDWLGSAGVHQYEISNFAHQGGQSRHNRRYWERRPYLGVGLDAHSMLPTAFGSALRWANTDVLDAYLGGLVQLGSGAAWVRTHDRVDTRAAFEETFFLGLRLLEGVDLAEVSRTFDDALLREIEPALHELSGAGLLLRSGHRIQLTARGREISNDVFERLLLSRGA